MTHTHHAAPSPGISEAAWEAEETWLRNAAAHAEEAEWTYKRPTRTRVRRSLAMLYAMAEKDAVQKIAIRCGSNAPHARAALLTPTGNELTNNELRVAGAAFATGATLTTVTELLNARRPQPGPGRKSVNLVQQHLAAAEYAVEKLSEHVLVAVSRGMTIKEAAAAVGLTPKGVRKHYHRALESFAGEWEADPELVADAYFHIRLQTD